MPLPSWANPPDKKGWAHNNNYSEAEVVWTHGDGRVFVQTPTQSTRKHRPPESRSVYYRTPLIRSTLTTFFGGAFGGAVVVVVAHATGKL